MVVGMDEVRVEVEVVEVVWKLKWLVVEDVGLMFVVLVFVGVLKMGE